MADAAIESSAVEPAPTGPARLDAWRRRAPRAVLDRLAATTPSQWGLVAIITAHTWYFTRTTLDIHHGLGTSAYDYGLYDQGVWLLSRFEAPFVTLMGRNLFGDHTSFILLLLVPVYWVFPSAGALLFTQSLVIGLGAVPVFLYARRRLGSERVALLLAGCYLLHPAVGWTNMENFHPDAFLGVLVGAAIYCALERHWRAYAVFVVLSLLVKEDASLVIVPLGVWVALRRDRRIGLLTVLGSLAFMLVAMFVVMRSLIGVPTRNTWRIPFGGPSGFLQAVVERPGAVVEHFRSDGRPWYLWQMTAPFAWVFARLPDVALISSVVLATNMLSTFWYQYQVQYHYSLVAVPALALGTVHALGVVRSRWQPRLVAAVVATSVWAAFLWGPMSWARQPPPYWPPSHPVAVDARDIIRDVPDGAVVSAFHSLTAHLARREQIYMFPTPFRAVLYGPGTELEGQRLPAADEVEFVVLPVDRDVQLELDWREVNSEFELVRANDWWELYRRADRS
jgi:uncharacterized membrane protein